MQKFIHNVSLLASLVALAAGLWQDWGIWLTLQRMTISYLGFFFFGVLLFLIVRSVPASGGRGRSAGSVQRGNERPDT